MFQTRKKKMNYAKHEQNKEPSLKKSEFIDAWVI